MGKIVYINKNSLFDSQVILSQGDVISQYYDINDLRSAVAANNISSSTRMIALVEYTEGKRYKKRMHRVKKVI